MFMHMYISGASCYRSSWSEPPLMSALSSKGEKRPPLTLLGRLPSPSLSVVDAGVRRQAPGPCTA